VLFESCYYGFLWRDGFYWLFFLFLPLNGLLLIYILQLTTLLLSFLFLTVIKIIHLPQEGIFSRDIDDKDYFYWNIRNIVKKWPLYIAASNPFPWFKNRFSLRFFGVNIGKKSMVDNCWISSEFVSIGKNVIIGMGTTILTFGIEQDKFILKRIKIESDTLIGAKCVILPGTVLKKGVKLSAHSYTNYDDILEENKIYIGHPAKLKI
jgi:acetyltransferase-like isoleucine patch superfamily enzyme